MREQNRESQLTLAILGLLSLGPMTGYSLRKTFMSTAIKAYSSSPGAIYPALRRLEKDGRIEGWIERKHTLRPRMVYSLSQLGKTAFIESLTQPITREDVVQRMDSLFLRFSFMSGLVKDDQIAAFLQALSAETESYLKELEIEYEKSAPGLPFSGRAALELGVKSFRTTLEWAREILAELQQQSMTGETDEK